jgi:hypothetical protein
LRNQTRSTSTSRWRILFSNHFLLLNSSVYREHLSFSSLLKNKFHYIISIMIFYLIVSSVICTSLILTSQHEVSICNNEETRVVVCEQKTEPSTHTHI